MLVKKNGFIAFLLICINCFAQKKDVAGTYFMTFGEKGYMGCCRENEVVRLNSDHTFLMYTNNDQGDYHTEGMSHGIFKVMGDSIFFLSQTPNSTGILKSSFNDSIDKNLIRLVFAQRYETIEGFLDNNYYAVDDSFKISKLKVIKTDPLISTLFDTISYEYKYNYKKNLPVKKFIVYLERNNIKISNLLIIGNNKNLNIGIASLNIPNTFSGINNVDIDLNKKSDYNYFDYSGCHFKIDKDDLLPVGDGAGTVSNNILYKKLTPEKFDSLIFSVSTFDSVSKHESLVVKNNKSIKYNRSSYSFKSKSISKVEKNFILSDEEYHDLLKLLSESSFYKLTKGERHLGSFNSIYFIGLYYKEMHFINSSEFFSKELYSLLFNSLSDKE